MDFSSRRGLTASVLTKKTYKKLARAQCDDIARVIDAKISTMHESGANEIEYELPINFDITGMDRYDAQTLIYSELIMIYLDKGFESDNVGIEYLKGGKAIFHIRWINGMDDDERRDRKKLLHRHIWK